MNLLLWLVKLLRKHNASLAIFTHNITDFLPSEASH